MKIIKSISKALIFIVVIFLIIFSIFIVKGYIMYKNALENAPIDEKISELKKKNNYYNVSSLPKTYVNAVIAAEDHRFYDHGGIDIIATSRALLHDLKAWKFVEGGSTITQQLAKNIYFTQEKKIERKIAEIFMAFKLEKKFSKDEILEFYLNSSYFGDGYYTVKEASAGYFGKEPKFMTDYESALLAGIPNAPSVYSPTKNLNLSLERQRQVINQMLKYNFLTEEKAQKILNEGD